MAIKYAHFSNAWIDFYDVLTKLLTSPQITKNCELGAGANPYLPLDFIESHGLEYTILDISAEELQKAPDGYHKLQADITDSKLNLSERYDLVFSMQLAEHVISGLNFHQNIQKILHQGGYSFHLFPTLYAIPFMMNRYFPQDLSTWILLLNDPSRIKEGNRGKFPAYYSWCQGPTEKQMNNFETLGFEIEEYVGFFGHDYYLNFPPLKALSEVVADKLLKKPIPQLTTYAYVLLRNQHA
ncbi:MAG: methyltransferase domain-containing protein [Nostocaceae cyanobacterium]|nr:methyltransferase domain-containing protein [Nostocaceae cyanobacterium]